MSLDKQRFVDVVTNITQILCPGALTLHVARIDTPESHTHRSPYQADVDYFRTQPSRRLLIRECATGEFDFGPSSSQFDEEYPALEFQNATLPCAVLRSVKRHVPRLWCVVTKLAPGAHQVVTIYRGKPLWKVIDHEGRDIGLFASDDAVVAAMTEVQQREGVDKPAWEAFLHTCWNAFVAAQTPRTNATRVN